MVELALGGTLFVTLLILGIYASEASLLTLKVQEAGNFALWDSTGRRVHEFTGSTANYGPFGSLPNTVGNAATLRYQDFDGTGTARVGIKLARTQGTQMRVQCQPGNVIDFQVVNPGGLRHGAMYADLQQFFQPGQGFVQCQADAQIQALKVPTAFLDGPAGLFNNGARAANMVQRPTMRVCSDRWCNGRLGVLLGTWALEGPSGDQRNDEVWLNDNGAINPTFYGMTKKLFDDNGKGEASPSRVKPFVTAIARETPAYNEDNFYMSMRGIESDYYENITGLKGRMTVGGAPIPQTRGYDTNGAPLELYSGDVWKWQRPAGGCGGCVNPSKLARRSDLFLGLPTLVP
jgi:hypothetical protein